MFTPYVDELQKRPAPFQWAAYIGAIGLVLFFTVGMFASFRPGLFADLFAKPSSMAAGFSCTDGGQLEDLPQQRPTAAIKQALQGMDEQVRDINAQYMSARGQARNTKAAALRDVAQKRHNLVVDLMRQDPNTANQMVSEFAAEDLRGVPADCQSYPAEIQGELTAGVLEDMGGNSITIQTLATAQGEIEISVANNKTPLVSGMMIRVKGHAFGKNLLVDESETGALKVVKKERASNIQWWNPLAWLAAPVHAAIAASQGDQPTAVVMVQFRNQSINAGVTKDLATKTVFTDVKTVYTENSYGKTTITGSAADVYGVYTLPMDSNCGYSTIANAAVAAADNDVNFSQYSRLVIITPLAGCNYVGYGIIGKATLSTKDGKVPMGWTLNKDYGDASSLRYVISHELGHTFGAHHAGFYNCGTQVFCTTANTVDTEYGDPFSPMGYYRWGAGQMSAMHKDLIGWFNTGNLVTVTSSGTYVLEPYNTNTSGLKALKIPRGASGDNIYIEYRRPVGVDALRGTADNDGYSGAMMHNNSSLGANRTNLLDVSPPGNSKYPVLQPGQTVYDDKYKIRITTVSRTDTALVMDIQLNSSATSTPTPTPGSTTSPTPSPTSTASPTPTPTLTPTPAQSTGDDQAPKVSITSPSSGASIKRNTTQKLTASATDDIAVTRVDYYVNDSFICSSSTTDYPCNWSLPGKPNANYTVEAYAYDAAGNAGKHQITVKSTK